MKGFVLKMLIGVGVCVAGSLISGCEPQGAATNDRREKLFAAENIELKKQIEQMKQKHAKELAAKQEMLKKCEEEKKLLEEQLDKEAMKIFEDSVTNMLIEEAQKLQEENKQLKTQLKQLLGVSQQKTQDQNQPSMEKLR